MGGSAAAGRPDFACVSFSYGHIRRRAKTPRTRRWPKRQARTWPCSADAGKPLLRCWTTWAKNSGRPAKRAGNADESREIRQRLRLKRPRLYELDGADGDQRRQNWRFLLPRLFPHGDGRQYYITGEINDRLGKWRGLVHIMSAPCATRRRARSSAWFCGLYAGNVSPDDGLWKPSAARGAATSS